MVLCRRRFVPARPSPLPKRGHAKVYLFRSEVHVNAGFDNELIKRLIRRLDRDSFSEMINACLNLEYGSLVTPLPELGNDIWHRSVGYVKRNDDPNPSEKADAFYVVQHMPSVSPVGSRGEPSC